MVDGDTYLGTLLVVLTVYVERFLKTQFYSLFLSNELYLYYPMKDGDAFLGALLAVDIELSLETHFCTLFLSNESALQLYLR